MTPTCAWPGVTSCDAEAVAEFYQGGLNTLGFEPVWKPLCAKHIGMYVRASSTGLPLTPAILDENGYAYAVRALSPACAGCGHLRVGHVYGCRGTRQSGGPNGMTQQCPCPGYAATKAEAVAAR